MIHNQCTVLLSCTSDSLLQLYPWPPSHGDFAVETNCRCSNLRRLQACLKLPCFKKQDLVSNLMKQIYELHAQEVGQQGGIFWEVNQVAGDRSSHLAQSKILRYKRARVLLERHSDMADVAKTLFCVKEFPDALLLATQCLQGCLNAQELCASLVPSLNR